MKVKKNKSTGKRKDLRNTVIERDKKFNILVINPGSTSTKVSVYANEEVVAEKNLMHCAEELHQYTHVNDQLSFRKEAIRQFLRETPVSSGDLHCIVGRGGLLKPLPGGTYLIDEGMCEELRKPKKEHASNLGALLAKEIADELGIKAFIVDPVVVDEMQPLARISGLAGVERICIFHALNQKATARKAAQKLGKPYEECRFIVAHLGGGISVGAHWQGEIIDVNNCLDGEGPFSPERSGGIPTGSLINICFHSGLSEKQVYKALIGQGGLVSYLGTNDARAVEKMIQAGDSNAALIYEAMAYQVAKEIGSCAVVLEGKVDAILLTGGLAHSKMLVDWIIRRVKFIAQVLVFPGEGEMDALAAGALRILKNEEEYKRYSKL